MMQVVFRRFVVDAWPFALALLILQLVILWYRKRSLSYVLCFAVFGIYLLFALDKTLFPIWVTGNYADEMRQFRRFSAFVNLVPLKFNFTEIPRVVLLQMIQNVLLTIPFGFGVSFIVRLRAWHFLWLIPLVGLSFEGMQVLISLILRYPHRVIDINDAILNTLGVLIGYIGFRIFAWLYVGIMRLLRIRPGGLIGYLYEVSSHTTASP